jgi:hypothetical protein
MIIKYIAKGIYRGIAKGLDDWAESITQEQFNTRMGILLMILFLVAVGLVGHIEYLDYMELQGGR